VAKELSFPFIVQNYINKRNPETGKIYTKSEVCKLIGSSESYLAEWFLIVSKTNQQKVEEEGRIATDEELIAAYNAVHGVETVIATPFGLLYRKGSAPTS